MPAQVFIYSCSLCNIGWVPVIRELVLGHEVAQNSRACMRGRNTVETERGSYTLLYLPFRERESTVVNCRDFLVGIDSYKLFVCSVLS